MAWFIHYLMIGAYTGGLLNIVSLTKNILLSKRDKWKWLGSVWFTVGVSVLSFAVYIVSFTVFNPSPTIDVMLVELLPVGAMIVSTLALQNRDAKKVRLLSLICSPMWLTYNAVNGSIGGIITECFSIVSIIIAFLRLDRKKK